jgi:hypothetical protein
MICALRGAINGFNVFLQLYGEAQASLPIIFLPHPTGLTDGFGVASGRKEYRVGDPLD